MRVAFAVIATLVALAMFGLAIQASGLQLISDCAEPLRGPLGMVLVCLAGFVLGAIVAVRIVTATAYPIIVGVAALVLLNDYVQGFILNDVLTTSCQNRMLR